MRRTTLAPWIDLSALQQGRRLPAYLLDVTNYDGACVHNPGHSKP